MCTSCTWGTCLMHRDVYEQYLGYMSNGQYLGYMSNGQACVRAVLGVHV